MSQNWRQSEIRIAINDKSQLRKVAQPGIYVVTGDFVTNLSFQFAGEISLKIG